MKKLLFVLALLSTVFLGSSCNKSEDQGEQSTVSATNNEKDLGEAAVNDDVSEKNILQIALSSPDHTTLVKLVQAANMEHVLTNAGPLTVFAPTNEAFAQLPEGTVENLMKPENKETLKNIILYHAAAGSYGPDNIAGVMGIGQANLQKVDVVEKDGDVYVNGAKVIASVKASNGWVHVIDKVLLPPEK